MSYGYADTMAVAQAQADVRATFIRRTYGHLAGAILAFVALEAVLLQIPGVENVVVGMSRLWIGVIAAWMVISWLARTWAASAKSIGMQYVGLAVYVVGQAVLFLPMLYYAAFMMQDKTVIPTAGILTLGVFAGLTAAVFVTRKDFSYLGSFLSIAGFIALGLIVASCIFGFSLGLIFSFAMVALACAAILYDTSNVLHHYGTEQYVAASVELFASVALLFWYVLRIAMASRE
jgi:FtsH-binding integral membrane protein